MSHTHWDPKGMVKKRPGGFTYYGGNTRLSEQYKQRFLPHYDRTTKMSNPDWSTDDMASLQKSSDFNTYEKRTWYQNNLDKTTKPEFVDFPGTHAEWRKGGDFDKSYRKYNSQFVYDFKVDVTTTSADGVVSTQQIRTSDHTEVTKLRRDMEEKERYDIQDRKNIDFNDVNSPPRDEIDREMMMSRPSTSGNGDGSEYFNRSGGGPPSSPIARPRPSTTMSKHPSINAGLCREHPKDTFRNKNRQKPLFGSTGLMT